MTRTEPTPPAQLPNTDSPPLPEAFLADTFEEDRDQFVARCPLQAWYPPSDLGEPRFIPSPREPRDSSDPPADSR